jgi:hypothetical protein
MYCTELYLLAPSILKITISEGRPNLINMMISEININKINHIWGNTKQGIAGRGG